MKLTSFWIFRGELCLPFPSLNRISWLRFTQATVNLGMPWMLRQRFLTSVCQCASHRFQIRRLVDSLMNSQYWRKSAMIITFDENGGRWDHVAPPPPADRWGPGTRIPTIV